MGGSHFQERPGYLHVTHTLSAISTTQITENNPDSPVE